MHKLSENVVLYYMMVRVSFREKFLHIARDLVIIWFLLEQWCEKFLFASLEFNFKVVSYVIQVEVINYILDLRQFHGVLGSGLAPNSVSGGPSSPVLAANASPLPTNAAGQQT